MVDTVLPAPALRLSRHTTVHAVRTGLFVIVFFVAIFFQLAQGEYFAPAIWLPVNLLLALTFILNAGYFLGAEKLEKKSWVHGMLFVVDALVISGVIYFTGFSRSIFFFMYLINIILAGYLFQRRGAFSQALWTSVLFNCLLLLGTQTQDSQVYFLLALNNVAFFLVAYLGGSLSEQIDLADQRLVLSERKLMALEDLHRLIFTHVGNGLITVDADGVINSANPAALKITDGLSVVGRNISSLFPELQFARNMIPLRSDSNALRTVSVEFVNKTREKLQLEVVITHLKDDAGQEQGHVVLLQDRTEVRRLEATVRQKEKLAAVGQLAAGIAHEIRNPLASLSGSVQLMAAQPERYSDDDLKLMRIILREIDRLNGLITEFLDYVKPEKKPDELVDVNKVMREVLEMSRFNSKKEIEISQRLKAQCLVLGHADKLKQAFLNIVINAFQAMESSAHAHLDVESFDVVDRLVIKIKDSGQGMSEETRTRLFEPFYTTKSKGTGLGLAVTYKILENHGAHVQVTSREGEGSLFQIDFPVIRHEGENDFSPARQA